MIGRFLQGDPKADSQLPSPFVYGQASPAKFVDQTGYFTLLFWLFLEEAGEGSRPSIGRQVVEGAVAGNAIEDPNAAQTVGAVGFGFTPLGWTGDVRDTTIELGRLNRGEGSWKDVGMAGVGFLPLGDLLKGVSRGARHALKPGYEIAEEVVWRIHKTDPKGRPYGGGPGSSPSAPTMEDFNPVVAETTAGDLVYQLEPRHGLNPEQMEDVSRMTNEELLAWNPSDPIGGYVQDGKLAMTGGHHRVAEISRRVEAGELEPDTPLAVLVHE